MGGVISIIFIITALISSNLIRQNAKNEWAEQLERLTLVLSEHASQTLFSGITTLDSIFDVVKNAKLTDEKSFRNFATKEAQYKILVEKTTGNSIIDVASFVSNSGKILNFSRSFPPPSIDLSDRDYFNWFSSHNSPDIFFSEPVKNKGNGKWVFYLSRRVNNNNGDFLGVILVGISSEVFSKFYERIGSNLSDKAALVLYRNDYTLMTRWPFKEELIGKKNSTGAAKTIITDLKLDHGMVLTDSPRFAAENARVNRMVAARSIGSYPFIATAAIEEDLYLPNWFEGLTWIWSSLIFGITLICVSVWFLLRANKKIGAELSDRIAAQGALDVANKALKTIAYRDPLTGLPNQQKMMEELGNTISRLKLKPHFCAILYINLDNFGELNDLFGRDRGDILLKQVSIQLLECVEKKDIVARFEGDEFFILLTDLSNQNDAALAMVEKLSRNILTKMSNTTYNLSGVEYRNSASIGVHIFSNENLQINYILKQAGIALYESKLSGKNTFKVFAPDMQLTLDSQKKLLEGLEHAIDRKQLALYYQPQFDINLNLIGAEALLRWNIPKVGDISPEIFIPLAEKNGLIKVIGAWVLEQASSELLAWSKLSHMNDLILAVNISAQQIQMENFTGSVIESLKNHGASPERLMLELTESMLITNLENVSQKMVELKSYGIKLAIDDFGVGYSSLSYLKRLALDQIKIDKSFIRDVLVDKNDEAIVKTIITLGKLLGLDVMAEGVETMEQYLYLSSIQCNAYQGYFLSKPLPANEFRDFALTYKNKVQL